MPTVHFMGWIMSYEKIKIYATVATESGRENRISRVMDYQANTPLEAINELLKEFDGPRGKRIKEIEDIEVNVTPPLSSDEMGERRVQYEPSGVFIHQIQLGVNG